MQLTRGMRHAKRSRPQPTLDMEALERLTLGDRKLQERILTTFLDHIPRARLVLAGGLESQELGEELHRLEGSCHFIQAPRLLRAVQERRSAQAEGWQAAMERIGRELDLVEEEIRRLVKSYP